MIPTKPQPIRPLRQPPMAIVTLNVNGFHSKATDIDELLVEEQIAVLALQETLVTARHYPMHCMGIEPIVQTRKRTSEVLLY